jgi:hypothetical protein
VLLAVTSAGVPDEDGLLLYVVAVTANALAGVDAVDVVGAFAHGVPFVDADTHGSGFEGVACCEKGFDSWFNCSRRFSWWMRLDSCVRFCCFQVIEGFRWWIDETRSSCDDREMFVLAALKRMLWLFSSVWSRRPSTLYPALRSKRNEPNPPLWIAVLCLGAVPEIVLSKGERAQSSLTMGGPAASGPPQIHAPPTNPKNRFRIHARV